MSAALTIAIPTYRRPTKLAATLAALQPQLRDNCEIWVLDNAASEEVRQIVEDGGTANVHYLAHPANIGLAGNVLRCFEAGQAPLLWILGDDDHVSPHAVNIILSACDRSGGVAQWNFSSFFVRPQSFECRNSDDLFSRLDSFPNLNFISANVYDRQRILPYISEGYRMAGSLCPHTAITIAAACDGQAIAFRSEQLCERPPVAQDDSWSYLRLVEVLPLLCELPCLSPSAAEKLRGSIQRGGKIHNFYVASLIMNPRYHRVAAARYAQFRARWFGRNPSLPIRVRTWLYAIVLKQPRLAQRMAELVAKSLGRFEWLNKYRELASQHDRE